jgi:hypothetical protein
MEFLQQSTKYNLKKRKIIDEEGFSPFNDDSLLSMESISECPQFPARDNRSHVEFQRPDTENVSLHSTRTTTKVKSPAGYGSASKRPTFSFDESSSQVLVPAYRKLTDSSSHFSYIRALFKCFG